MLSEPWSITLFGGLSISQPARAITRFRTQKTGALLAYLAYYQRRSHPREQLIELLWPESDAEDGRASLRTALASLRRQLEPPGVAAGSVLYTDRGWVRLNPDAIRTDVAEFEARLDAATRALVPEERAASLSAAVEGYSGELLPGIYDEWVFPERERLAEAWLTALRQLAGLWQRLGDPDAAIRCAQQAVAADPTREATHCELMQLYGTTGRSIAVLRQYQVLARVLQREFNESPSPATRALVERLRSESRTPASAGTVEPALPETPPLRAARGDRRLPPSRLGLSTPAPPALPLPFTRFFGREEELRRLLEIVGASEARLVTLTGLGGAGKTRLAVRLAERLPAPLAGGALFVPLADLMDPRLIPDAILHALRLPPLPGIEPIEQLATVLKRRRLLILDNFEHLLEAGALVLRELLERAPAVTCVVTSRQCLRLAGERVFPVLPLPLPTPALPLEELLRCESVQLFVDRAQSNRPDFQVTPRNAPAVAELCSRLEGIPLALELAAARAQVFTPTQMLTQLENRLEFLVGRDRDTTARHHTLRAALDWSYQLLPEAVQRFFARLSVFRGGWTLAAAEAVCVEGQVRRDRVLDYTAQLQESSLVLAEDIPCGFHAGPTDSAAGEELRFRMLETVREYSERMLREAREEESLRRKHLSFFLQLAEAAEPKLIGTEQATWLERLELEHDNLRAGLDWSQEDAGAAQEGLRLAGAVWRFWYVRGHVMEGRERLALALPRTEAEGPTAWRARALNAVGNLLDCQGDYSAAQSCYEQSLAIRRAIGDVQGVATGLNNLGRLAYDQDEYAAAQPLLQESLAIWRRLDGHWGIAHVLNNLGLVARGLGDYARARALFQQSLTMRRDFGDRWGIADSLTNLGILAYEQGDYVPARTLLEESLAIQRELGNQRGVAASLGSLGNVACDQGDYASARSLYGQSLALAMELGNRRAAGVALTNLGIIAHEQGDQQAARHLHQQALEIRRGVRERAGVAASLNNLGAVATEQGDAATARLYIEESLAIHQDLGNRHGEALARNTLGNAACSERDYAQARKHYEESLRLRRELGNKGGIAQCLERLAGVWAAQGHREAAARLLGAASALRAVTGAAVLPPEQAHLDRSVAALQLALGTETFQATWAEGLALSLDETLDYALDREISSRQTASVGGLVPVTLLSQ